MWSLVSSCALACAKCFWGHACRLRNAANKWMLQVMCFRKFTCMRAVTVFTKGLYLYSDIGRVQTFLGRGLGHPRSGLGQSAKRGPIREREAEGLLAVHATWGGPRFFVTCRATWHSRAAAVQSSGIFYWREIAPNIRGRLAAATCGIGLAKMFRCMICINPFRWVSSGLEGMRDTHTHTHINIHTAACAACQVGPPLQGTKKGPHRQT